MLIGTHPFLGAGFQKKWLLRKFLPQNKKNLIQKLTFWENFSHETRRIWLKSWLFEKISPTKQEEFDSKVDFLRKFLPRNKKSLTQKIVVIGPPPLIPGRWILEILTFEKISPTKQEESVSKVDFLRKFLPRNKKNLFQKLTFWESFSYETRRVWLKKLL